ncbi:hypothetical protein ABUW04_18610 [Streptacidiphilus sp. N1-10]|uniref:Gram-positive cocci surface proteins LPxTG domain-containing protein n=1 Tax=Streptacidiphilus jeojiensis TaxID=3229225 RepID=A0ABV6XPT1_9ACTN
MRSSRVVTAASAAVLMAGLAWPSAQAAGVVTVRQAQIDKGSPWAVTPDSNGVAAIGTLADPDFSDGSARLKIGPGQRAQLGHILNGKLSTVSTQPMSYDLYVNGSDSTASAVPFGANLQLVITAPTFTTLSFQPQLNGGVTAGSWHEFVQRSTSKWRTSRAFGTFAAGSDATLKQFLAAAGGEATVAGVILNVGALGDASASLDTYVDDVRVGGSRFNFATSPAREAPVRAPARAEPGGSFPAELTFISPSGGVRIPNATARVTFSGVSNLSADTVTVTPTGASVRSLRSGGQRAGSSYTTEVPVAGGALQSGGSTTASFTVRLAPSVGRGHLVVTGELLNDGTATGVTAQATVELPTPSSDDETEPGEHIRQAAHRAQMADTGSSQRLTPLAGAAAGLTVVGTALALVARRRRRRSQ